MSLGCLYLGECPPSTCHSRNKARGPQTCSSPCGPPSLAAFQRRNRNSWPPALCLPGRKNLLKACLHASVKKHTIRTLIPGHTPHSPSVSSLSRDLWNAAPSPPPPPHTQSRASRPLPARKWAQYVVTLQGTRLRCCGHHNQNCHRMGLVANWGRCPLPDVRELVQSTRLCHPGQRTSWRSGFLPQPHLGTARMDPFPRLRCRTQGRCLVGRGGFSFLKF